jgi:hypothetical protein
MDLLCLMFECEERGVLSAGGKPLSDQQVAAAVSGDTSANLLALSELLRMGVARRNGSGAIFNKRMVLDEQERQRWRKSKVESRKSPEIVPGNVPAMSRPSSSSLSPSNSSTDSKAIAPGFDVFWDAYPRQVGKPKAKKAWSSILKADEHLADILDGVSHWKASQQWADPQYIPYPATFLNQRRWEDREQSGGQVASKHQQRQVTSLTAAKRVMERHGGAPASQTGLALPRGNDRA